MLFLEFFNFKGYPETSMCVVAAYLFIEHCIDVLHVFKVNCNSTVLGFLRSLVFLLVNLDVSATWIWFSVAVQRKPG